MREKMGLPSDQIAMDALKADQKATTEAKRGTYDFFNDRDRWQFLSKELAQKQELIH